MLCVAHSKPPLHFLVSYKNQTVSTLEKLCAAKYYSNRDWHGLTVGFFVHVLEVLLLVWNFLRIVNAASGAGKPGLLLVIHVYNGFCNSV